MQRQKPDVDQLCELHSQIKSGRVVRGSLQMLIQYPELSALIGLWKSLVAILFRVDIKGIGEGPHEAAARAGVMECRERVLDGYPIDLLATYETPFVDEYGKGRSSAEKWDYKEEGIPTSLVIASQAGFGPGTLGYLVGFMSGIQYRIKAHLVSRI